MKYELKPTNKFQKDLKKMKKRGYDINLITDVIKLLANDQSLPEKHRDHSLTGNSVPKLRCQALKLITEDTVKLITEDTVPQKIRCQALKLLKT